MLGNKASLNKLKKTEIILSIFSNYGMKHKENKNNERLETKQHTIEKTHSTSKYIKEKIKNNLRRMKVEMQASKIFRRNQKQYYL